MGTSVPRPLPPRSHLYRHLARNFAVAVLVVCLSLSAGAVGYRTLEGLGWLDAFYSAAMILTGMGPTAPLTHPGTKVFAILYSLFSGLVFVTVMTLVLAPLARRFLHRLHLESTKD